VGSGEVALSVYGVGGKGCVAVGVGEGIAEGVAEGVRRRAGGGVRVVCRHVGCERGSRAA